MRDAPVKLDDEAVLLVERVPVLGPAVARCWCLPDANWQEVGPLDVANVAVLEDGMLADGIGREQFGEQRATADSAAP